MHNFIFCSPLGHQLEIIEIRANVEFLEDLFGGGRNLWGVEKLGGVWMKEFGGEIQGFW